MKSLCAVLLALLCGCSSLRDSAHGATALDAVTTAAGVASGTAVEVNPLIGSPAAFAGIMLARVIGCQLTIDNLTNMHSIRFSRNGVWGSTQQFTIANNPTNTVPYFVIASASSTSGSTITYGARFSAAEQSYNPGSGWDWNKTTEFFPPET